MSQVFSTSRDAAAGVAAPAATNGAALVATVLIATRVIGSRAHG